MSLCHVVPDPKDTVVECSEQMFNQATHLMDDDEYKAKEQMSIDSLEYTFFAPQVPLCYMTGHAMQGPKIKTLAGPLIDVETYMQRAPLEEQLKSHTISDHPRNLQPKTPAILNNKTFIPDCESLMRPERQRQPFEGRDRDTQEQVIRQGPISLRSVGIGSDTRQEVKDYWLKKQKGYKPEDPWAFKPQQDISCRYGPTGNDCMHLMEDTQPTPTTILAPQVGKAPTLENIASAPYATLGGQITKGLPSTASNYSAQTMAIAEGLKKNRTIGDASQELLRRRGCQVEFYAYKPNCSK